MWWSLSVVPETGVLRWKIHLSPGVESHSGQMSETTSQNTNVLWPDRRKGFEDSGEIQLKGWILSRCFKNSTQSLWAKRWLKYLWLSLLAQSIWRLVVWAHLGTGTIGDNIQSCSRRLCSSKGNLINCEMLVLWIVRFSLFIGQNCEWKEVIDKFRTQL